jgi:hypothetical protein
MDVVDFVVVEIDGWEFRRTKKTNGGAVPRRAS